MHIHPIKKLLVLKKTQVEVEPFTKSIYKTFYNAKY